MFDFDGSLLVLPDIQEPEPGQRALLGLLVYKHQVVDYETYCEGCSANSLEVRSYVTVNLHHSPYEPMIVCCQNCLADLYDTAVHKNQPWHLTIWSPRDLPGSPAPQFFSGRMDNKWNIIPGEQKCSHGFSVHSRCPVVDK